MFINIPLGETSNFVVMNTYTDIEGVFSCYDNEATFEVTYHKNVKTVTMSPNENADSYSHTMKVNPPLGLKSFHHVPSEEEMPNLQAPTCLYFHCMNWMPTGDHSGIGLY